MLAGRPWFKKLLMSYLPVLLGIVAVLTVLFVLAAVGMGRKEAVRANRIFASHVLQSVDYSLRMVDQMMLNELGINEMWKDFFEPRPQTNKYLAEYQLSGKLAGIVDNYPLVDSIYLLRFKDRMVMTNHSMMHYDNLPDKSFLHDVQQDRPDHMRFWTNPRSADSQGAEERGMFSLVLPYPLLSGESGIVVVNFQTSALGSLLAGFSESGLSFARLYDDSGAYVAGTDSPQGAGDGRGQRQDDSLGILARIKSDYTGWEVRSGLREGGYAKGLSISAEVWFILVILTVLAGIGFIIYMTIRNYKPIGKIMDSIETYVSMEPPRLHSHGGRDEFFFIAKALDDLIRQTGEDVVYRRRLFFQELLEEGRTVTAREWQEQLRELGIKELTVLLQAGMVEIDRYEDFCRTYSRRDQGLLKFALGNVLSELAEQKQLHVWTEWLSSQRMGLLILYRSGEYPDGEGRARQAADGAVEWIRQNLRITVTVALGIAVEKPSDTGMSYESAVEAMKYKSVLGSCRVITQLELPLQAPGDVFSQLQPIRAMATAFRLGDEGWREGFIQVMEAMKQGRLSRDDIANLMGYMLYQLNLELSQLPEEARKVWENAAAPELGRIIGGMETLQELSHQVLPILEGQADLMWQARESRAAHTMIREARRFIEENYANPDMSLTYVGEHFHIKSNYFSRLFKEETGENFVDYLARIRTEQAMRLLKETELAVQEVAVRVGYTHYVSFNRVFKRFAGVTPGEYRK